MLSLICCLIILTLLPQNPTKKEADIRQEVKEVNTKLDTLLKAFNIPIPCDTIRTGRIRDGSTIYYILQCGDSLKYVEKKKK